VRLYFVSSNPKKREDVARIFADSSSPPAFLDHTLVEVLSHDLREVVSSKARAAYRIEQVPLLVEHGALYIDHLGGLPGPMVKLFWEKLDHRLCEIIPGDERDERRRARVTQMVCFCDGRRLQVFEGSVNGRIALGKRGMGGMHWEPMFVPEGHDKTYGEMTPDERIEAHAATQAYRKLRQALMI
jgi:XTP/dITP diphosphohydrolase